MISFAVVEVCRAFSRVIGEIITPTHTWIHTLSRIDPSAHFQSKGSSQIGHGVKIHLLLQYMSDFIFTACPASRCGQKKNTNKAYYTFVQFIAKYLVSVPPPPFQCLCVQICVCANSCLLNIIGISAGGLIKKQLPLVAVGDAWRE